MRGHPALETDRNPGAIGPHVRASRQAPFRSEAGGITPTRLTDKAYWSVRVRQWMCSPSAPARRRSEARLWSGSMGSTDTSVLPVSFRCPSDVHSVSVRLVLPTSVWCPSGDLFLFGLQCSSVRHRPNRRRHRPGKELVERLKRGVRSRNTRVSERGNGYKRRRISRTCHVTFASPGSMLFNTSRSPRHQSTRSSSA